MKTIDLDKKYVANTYGRYPVEPVKASGARFTDVDGKEYIDLGSGIAVNTFGFSDPEWVEAVEAQLKKFQHTSNYYYTEPCAKLAEQLCKRTGMKKVFFGNSGAEANECAIKAARGWAQKNKGAEYGTIITLKDSFHGRTLTTLAATGQDVFHKDFLPLTPGFVYADPSDPESLKKLAAENKCAAIMIEVIQGEGGVNVLSNEFIAAVNETAKEYDLLIVVDEVQTGNGRTGKLFGYMNFDLKPDIISTAKGLGGGLPIGVAMMGEKAEFVLGAGMHGSTFGGNPVCSAGALNILSRIDDELLAGVNERSKYIFSELEGAKGIKSLCGMGLMIGISTEKDAHDLALKCLDKGVALLTAKDKLRLLPPLNIDMNDLKEAIEIIKEVCAE